MESITGMSASETLGKNGLDLFPHLQEQKVDILLQRALAGETVRSLDIPYHVPQTKKSGWVSGIYSPHLNGKGEIIGVIGIISDITERRNAQNELIGAKTFLDLILNTIADPVFVKDEKHRRILVNDAYCRFLRLSREELIKKSDHDLYPHDQADSLTREDNMVFASGTGRITEEQITDGQGRVHTIVTKKTLLVDGLENRFIVGIAREVTERKLTEEVLRESEQQFRMLLSHPNRQTNVQELPEKMPEKQDLG
jgi:PAS domain S-box-containing protein